MLPPPKKKKNRIWGEKYPQILFTPTSNFSRRCHDNRFFFFCVTNSSQFLSSLEMRNRLALHLAEIKIQKLTIVRRSSKPMDQAKKSFFPETFARTSPPQSLFNKKKKTDYEYLNIYHFHLLKRGRGGKWERW